MHFMQNKAVGILRKSSSVVFCFSKEQIIKMLTILNTALVQNNFMKSKMSFFFSDSQVLKPYSHRDEELLLK